jgi:hypothetical protein
VLDILRSAETTRNEIARLNLNDRLATEISRNENAEHLSVLLSDCDSLTHRRLTRPGR